MPFIQHICEEQAQEHEIEAKIQGIKLQHQSGYLTLNT